MIFDEQALVSCSRFCSMYLALKFNTHTSIPCIYVSCEVTCIIFILASVFIYLCIYLGVNSHFYLFSMHGYSSCFFLILFFPFLCNIFGFQQNFLRFPKYCDLQVFLKVPHRILNRTELQKGVLGYECFHLCITANSAVVSSTSDCKIVLCLTWQRYQ